MEFVDAGDIFGVGYAGFFCDPPRLLFESKNTRDTLMSLMMKCIREAF